MAEMELSSKIRERYNELTARLNEVVTKALETKSQVDELERLLKDLPSDSKLYQKLQSMRQSKLAENNLAVNEAQDLQARLKIHEELMKVLEADENAAK